MAPQASHPSITAPLRIWLRRFIGTAVWLLTIYLGYQSLSGIAALWA